jgi:hypothetical protein
MLQAGDLIIKRIAYRARREELKNDIYVAATTVSLND